MAFSHSSRGRLTDKDLGRFPGDTLFDRLARAVCHAGCLPRKELYEAWEMARRARRLFRGGRIVDLGAGHGLLAQVMLILDDSSSGALVVDKALPASSAPRARGARASHGRGCRAASRSSPRALDDVEIQSTDVVVSSHACGRLTDLVLELAVAAGARVAVLPCCHDLATCDAGELSGWVDGAVAIDVMRAVRLEQRGYRIWTQSIPAAVTPKNRLLLGAPVAQSLTVGASRGSLRRDADPADHETTVNRSGSAYRQTITMSTFLSDLRLAVRGLRRSPLFAIVAILSLALGIGANTAIFTLIDQVLLRKLPVTGLDELVMLYQQGAHNGSNMGSRMHSYPIYQDYQQQAEPLAEVLCRRLVPASVSVDNRTERLQAELVSGNYFSMLGVKPAIGRVFNSQEDDQVYQGHPVVVLSYDYWVSRFARDPGVIGKKILVNDSPMTIVGVSAAGFAGIDPAQSPQIRVPVLMKPVMTPEWTWLQMDDRRARWVQVFAQAEARLHGRVRGARRCRACSRRSGPTR